MWPPASPDLNPMDFSVWSLLEEKDLFRCSSIFDALKTSLRSEWAKIPQETLHASVSNFGQRIERVIEGRDIKLKIYYLNLLFVSKHIIFIRV